MNQVIYHIIPRAEWEAAGAAGVLDPASLAAEGFIHCSTFEQVAGVAGAFYREVPDLVLLHIDVAMVAPELRYEGDDTGFPHIYGALDVAAVVYVQPYALDAAGVFPPPDTLELDAGAKQQEGIDDAGC